MSDNYVQFSFAIDTNGKDEKEWLLQLEDLIDSYIDAGDEWDCDTHPFLNDGEVLALQKVEAGTGVTIDECRHLDQSNVFIYADESGSTEFAALVCQLFLARFRPEECISFTWAEYPTKPRVNEFGGGFCVVTAQEIHFESAHHRLEEFKKAMPGTKSANLE